jgi:AcrR family transcriptional regulator
MAEVKPSRRERSLATRRKIIHAAEAEFLDKGFHGATVAAIADRAGVAAQTVYFVFHNKVDLISAVIDSAVLGEDEPTPPQLTAWWKAMVAEPDAVEALRIYVRGTGPIFSRASPISVVLYAATLADPDLRATWEMHQNLRAKSFRLVIEMLATKQALKAGLTIDTATDVLMTILGESTYHRFIAEQGWSEEQLVAWYCDALPVLLLETR